MSTHRAASSNLRGWVTQAVAWVAMAAVVLLLAVSVLIPRLAGATPFTILTGSMRPGMPPGTLVVVKPVTFEDIGIGSVITYQLESGNPAVVTHRVVAVGSNLDGEPFLETRGDANQVSDEKPVIPDQVKGERWYHVPYAGYVVNVFTAGQRQTMLAVVVAGLIVYALAMFAGAARGQRHRSSTQLDLGEGVAR